jgi:hypothetical protein
VSGRDLLTAPQVARRFSRSLGWFRRMRPSLEARGFPLPVDGCGLRWDPAAIDDWLDAQRRPAVREFGAVMDGEAELIRRAAALAVPA